MKTMQWKKWLLRWGVPAVLTALLVLFTIWINRVDKVELISRSGQTFEKGVVTKILENNIQEDGTRVGEQRVVVRMTTGVRKGQELETTSSAGYLFGAACEEGMHVIVMQSVAGDSTITSIYAQDRELAIYVFGGAYLLALVLIGGKKGVKGALGLAFTFLAFICIDLPLAYRGYSPFLIAIALCAVTTLVTMYLIGGPTKKTLCATIGTTAGVILAGVTARLFGAAAGLSGWNVSNIESLLDLWYTCDIQVGELLFSGLLISSLGAVMDVAMSISSAMDEVVHQNPEITGKELFGAGLRIGRDMMGTDSNTLILAFVGGSMSSLLLNYAYDLPYQQVINSNNIGIAIMQGVGGSFGVVLCVPITVLLASLLLRSKQPLPTVKQEDSKNAVHAANPISG